VPRDQLCPPTRVGKASNKPNVLPSIARQNCDWDTLRAMHLYQKPSNNRLGSRSQTSALKKERDLDHASRNFTTRQLGGFPFNVSFSKRAVQMFVRNISWLKIAMGDLWIHFTAPGMNTVKQNSVRLLVFISFCCWIHTASTPITAGTHTDGGAVIR